MNTPPLVVPDPQSSSMTTLHAALLARAEALLADLTAFQTYLRSEKKGVKIEIGGFIRDVRSEVKILGRLTGSSPSANDCNGDASVDMDEEEKVAKKMHALRSSNLPFHEAVWSTAKRCQGVTALKKNDLVHVVADNGAEWIKISLITERRILFEMANQGWEGYGDGSDSDAYGSCEEDFNESDKAGGLKLLRLAENIKLEAKKTRVRYRHPRIRFILPNIREGSVKEVDAVLADMRATGAVVQCGGGSSHTDNPSPLGASSDLFARMTPSSRPPLTSTINIDCTILLALISDISHLSKSDLPSPPNGTYDMHIEGQISYEAASPLLPNELYPVLEGRGLICTHVAAGQMRHITNTIGTIAERTRTEILFAEDKFGAKSAQELRTALQDLSTHPVPPDLQLPIKEVEFEVAAPDSFSPTQASTRDLPSEAWLVSEKMNLSPVNRSVFLYGWRERVVTLTSNREVAAGIEKTLHEILNRHEDRVEGRRNGEVTGEEVLVGPDVWICRHARSLISKGKGNWKNGKGKGGEKRKANGSA